MKCYEGIIISVDANDGVYRYLVEDNGQTFRRFEPISTEEAEKVID